MSLYAKDPGALLDYEIDWSAYLQNGETVVTSDWEVAPAETEGLSIAGHGHDPQRSTVTLAAGVTGHLYRVTNRMTTSQGRQDQRSLSIRVVDR